MKKKRLTLLSLALALCLSLSACAGKDARVVSNAGAEEKKTEISLLTTSNNTTAYNALNSAIAVFEDRRPDVRVVFEGYNTGEGSKNLSQVIDERIASGQINDMTTMDVVNIFRYGGAGKIADLTDSEAARDLTPLARQDSTVDGKVLSVPLSMVSFGTWVNMDVMKECGLELPGNWEEFVHCCAVLKEKGYQPIAGTADLTKLFVVAVMGDIYMDGDTDAIIARLNTGEEKISKYARTGFERVEYLINQGYIDGPASVLRKPKDIKEHMEKGEGVFEMHASNLLNPEELSFEVAFIGVPGTHGMVSPMACDRRFVVMADGGNVEACKEFLSCLGSGETLETLSGTFGLLPAYRSSEKSMKKDDRMAQVYDNIEAGRIMLIQDYNLVFEQWSSLAGIVDPMLTGASAESQCAAFDALQMKAVNGSK